MPQYFFDVEENGELSAGDDALEVADDQTARDEAIKGLASIAGDGLPNGPHHRFVVYVRDERGNHIFEASLEFRSAWLK
jgi:hypothetical protein